MLNNNMNQDNGMQKRMLMMTLVVFVFFIAYEFLVLKPQQEEKAKQAEVAKQEQQNSAPDVATTTNPTAQPAASGSDAPNAIAALSTKAIGNSEILTTIKTNKNIIQIDKLGRVAQVTLLEEKYKDEEGNQIKLFEANQLRPLEVRFADADINNKAFKTNYTTTSANVDASAGTQKLTLTQNIDNLVLTKEMTVYPNGHYDLSVKTSEKTQFFITKEGN